MLIWCLAARCGNRLPNDTGWIQARIGASKPVDLEALIAAGFLEEAETAQEKNRAEGWGSRYIPAQLREEVLRRGKGVCADCGSAENIEIDHICPVSRGGKSELDNLQLLCRSCNRRKRAKLSIDTKEPAEHIATQTNESAYSRDRGEGETEAEKKEPSPPATAISEPPAAFLKFWNTITSPRRKGERAEAFEAWKKVGKPEADYLIRQWAAYLASLGETFPKDVCRWLKKGIFRGPFEGGQKTKRVERPIVSAPLPKPPTPWTEEQQREARELSRRLANGKGLQ
jgi:hypothetical protein